MDELIAAMSNSDLAELKVKYVENQSVATLIEGILDGRAKEQAQVEAKEAFEGAIAKFANGVNKQGKPYLPHPDDVSNVFLRWGEVTIEVGEEEEVSITNPDTNELETVMRKPTQVVSQWIVEVNARTTKLTSGNDGGSAQKTSKRAITVFKRNGTQLEPKGNYPSASKACEALGLTIGGDSATRVLAREGYWVEAFNDQIGDLSS